MILPPLVFPDFGHSSAVEVDFFVEVEIEESLGFYDRHEILQNILGKKEINQGTMS